MMEETQNFTQSRTENRQQSDGIAQEGADSWFLSTPNGELGPFPAARVNGFVTASLVPAEAMVRNALSGEQHAAGDLPALVAERFSSQATRAEPPVPAKENASFGPERVQFQSFSGNLDPVLQGKGTVSVSGGMLAIIGRRRRLFAWGRRTENIPLDQIHDVIVDGRFLRFVVEGGKSPKPRLLRLGTPERALVLAACMPGRLSAAARQTIADSREFQTFLEVSGPAVATLAIIAINLVVFLIGGFKGVGWMSGDANVLLELGGNLAMATTGGQWWRLVSAMFLHAGLLHVGLNMWALWDAGRVAERLFGRLRYAALYLGAGLLGGIASINWQQDVVSVGASGAVFGVYGALLAALLLRKDLLPPSIAKQLQASATVMIGYSLFNGFTKVGIDNAAHIGGLVAGVLIGAALVIPARRSIAAVLTTLVLIGAGAVRAIEVAAPYRDELAFRQFIKTYGVEEARLNAQLLTLSTRAKDREIREAEFASVLETEIVPGWGAQDKAIAGLSRVTPRMQPVRDAMAKFIHLRYEALLLLRDAARLNDEAKFADFKKKSDEANAALVEIKQMGEQAAKKGRGTS